MPAQASARPAAPSNIWVTALASNQATIRWQAVPAATRYEVRSNGKRIALTRAVALRLRGLAPATTQRIEIVTWRGKQKSIISAPLAVTTRAATRCTHFVSTTGSDQNGTGSANNPWRTITRLTHNWQSGWVGCVRGRHVEDVTISRGGSAAAPVTLRSAPGIRSELVGRLVIQRGANHVVVANMNLDGRANTGLGREDLPSPTINGNFARFISNDVHNRRTRVCFVIGSIRGYGHATGTVLSGNRVHDCGKRPGNNHHHGIYVESATNTTIAHNVIYQNADRGIQLYPNAFRSLIANNIIDRNGQGVIFSGAEGYVSRNNRLVNNVITNSRTRYDVEYWWENPNAPGKANRVHHNCVGGGAWGSIARPAVGYLLRGNRNVRAPYRAAGRADYRLKNSRWVCANKINSAGLPRRAF